MTTPILGYPRDEGRYILDTDASDMGMGAVLSQEQDGKERVLAYLSQALTKEERRYCVTRKELLAVICAVRKCRQYLVGKKFLLRTDHGSLRWLTNFKEPQGQIARWISILGEYDYEIQHRPGRVHNNADALSRSPCTQCGKIDWKQAKIEAWGDQPVRVMTRSRKKREDAAEQRAQRDRDVPEDQSEPDVEQARPGDWMRQHTDEEVREGESEEDSKQAGEGGNRAEGCGVRGTEPCGESPVRHEKTTVLPRRCPLPAGTDWLWKGPNTTPAPNGDEEGSVQAGS